MIARKYVDFAKPDSVGLGYMFLDCVRWGSDAVAAAPPALSQEVMEDVQGKKIVFRDGWGPPASYLLLNYRDEGDGGLNFRDYLRDTIPVEEEKMTHGHADENSIPLLMAGGSVLLHDAGYRDYMPSGPFGAFRQDYFHNRLVVRPEKIFFGPEGRGIALQRSDAAVPGQGLLDFLRDAGSYRRVRTQKVDFLTLPDIDYVGTRMIDDNWGYSWDRVIAYVKEGGLFVVFDYLQVPARGVVHPGRPLAHPQDPRPGRALVRHRLRLHRRRERRDRDPPAPGQAPARRLRPTRLSARGRGAPEAALPGRADHPPDDRAQHFELGETTGFVTVLIPHPAGRRSGSPWPRPSRSLPVDSPERRTGRRDRARGRPAIVGAKCDLRRDMSRDNKRPRYTYEAGKVTYGDFETNGDFVFAALDGTALAYTIVNLTKALFKGRLLIERKPWLSGLAFDGRPGLARARASSATGATRSR